MVFKILSRSEAQGAYKALYKKIKRQHHPFFGFDLFYDRLFCHDFELLKKRFHPTTYALSVNGTAQILSTFYHPIQVGANHYASLGAILCHNNISDDDIHYYQKQLLSSIPDFFIAPLNGHFNLGFSTPDQGVDAAKVGFLTAPVQKGASQFFHNSPYFRKSRSALAFQVDVTLELQQKIDQELMYRPTFVRTRPISMFNFKHDIKIYNSLVNTCLVGHYRFQPLSFEEEWDLMKGLVTCLLPEYFQFLMVDGREVGFCFGIPDYNLIMKNENSDVFNILRAQIMKRKIPKARIIYSGILPEYRGQKLFKYVRHSVIQAMIRNGVRTIESSYVDEGNINSQGNVRSTGALPSHTFSVYEPTGR